MNLSRDEIFGLFSAWLVAWDHHDLDGVMSLFHENIVFENWNCATVHGKSMLRRFWTPWFLNHGDFKFIKEDVFIDEERQKLLFQWRLEWPSLEECFKGKREVRRGVDILHFLDAKINKKISYSKTTVTIDAMPVALQASGRILKAKVEGHGTKKNS